MVRIADIIAYINHDIDDAIRGEVISLGDIPRRLPELFGRDPFQTDQHDGERYHLRRHDKRDKGQLSITEEVLSAILKLRDFLWDRVYDNESGPCRFSQGQQNLEGALSIFHRSSRLFFVLIEKESLYDSLERCVCDFLAGMTDRYAFHLYEKLFLPLPWMIV